MRTVFVGAGAGCRAVLEMFEQGRLAVLGLEILAIVDIDPAAEGMSFAREQGWPTRSSIEEGLAVNGLELVIELTGSDRVLEQIYAHLPPGIRVMDHVMARVFWDLERATIALREELEHKTELQRDLVQAERLAAVGKLAAGVAHELNNPLTGILTFAEDLLQQAADDDPRRLDYELILNETLRCRRIVRDLLDFSRQREPERRIENLADVARRVVQMVERQAAFHNVTFDLTLSEGHLPPVSIDASQIQQALLNLVINVRDAMNGDGRVAIRAVPAIDGRTVVLSVEDEGRGIAPGLMERIFEPFFTTKGRHGNGLGLPAVKSVIEQHGGRVEVESVANRGTAFRLIIPAVARRASTADDREETTDG